MTRPLGVLVLLVAMAPATSQSVLRVGATRPFQTIQSAVDASVSGDLVLVDAGTYAPFAVVSKGIAVLADGAPYRITDVAGIPEVEIIGVPAGRSVTIGNARTTYADVGAPSLQISASAGAVRIRDVAIDLISGVHGARNQAVVEVRDCSTVWLEEVRMRAEERVDGTTANCVPTPSGGADCGLSGLQIQASTVVLFKDDILGYDNLSGNAPRWAGDAVRLDDSSTVWLLGGMVRIEGSLAGGYGGEYGGSVVHVLGKRWLRVTKCGRILLKPGAGGTRAGGTLAVDHDSGRGPFGQRALANCLGDDMATTMTPSLAAPIGTSTTYELWSSAAANYVTLLAGGTRFAAAPIFVEPLMLDFGVPYLEVSSGMVLGNTTHSQQLAIPADPSLLGGQWTLQTVLLTSLAEFVASHPAMLVVTP